MLRKLPSKPLWSFPFKETGWTTWPETLIEHRIKRSLIKEHSEFYQQFRNLAPGYPKTIRILAQEINCEIERPEPFIIRTKIVTENQSVFRDSSLILILYAFNRWSHIHTGNYFHIVNKLLPGDPQVFLIEQSNTLFILVDSNLTKK